MFASTMSDAPPLLLLLLAAMPSDGHPDLGKEADPGAERQEGHRWSFHQEESGRRKRERETDKR